MKIKPEHYAHMKDLISVDAHRIKPHREHVRLFGKFNDLEKRVRWDMYYLSIPSKWICDNLYSYANDEHIDTALRQIMAEIEPVTKS